jgi:hypothetical protein
MIYRWSHTHRICTCLCDSGLCVLVLNIIPTLRSPHHMASEFREVFNTRGRGLPWATNLQDSWSSGTAIGTKPPPFVNDVYLSWNIMMFGVMFGFHLWMPNLLNDLPHGIDSSRPSNQNTIQKHSKAVNKESPAWSSHIPVEPHKAVAEVSEIGNL